VNKVIPTPFLLYLLTSRLFHFGTPKKSIRNMSDPRDSADYEDHSSHDEEDSEDEHDHDDHGEPLHRFPPALSYHSDAQRSDAATVGSVLEDIEVESVLSLAEETPQHSVSLAPASSSENTLLQHSTTGGDFAITNVGSMEPPLDRSFLLQHALVSSLGDPRHVGFPSEAASYIGNKPPAPSSVKSFGSNVGSDDCGGSLDVETHSVGTRSIHSQDGLDVGNEPAAETEAAVASLTIDPYDAGGRRSPGGTLYKGRGIRRYQGRYMHLTMQRFHHQNRDQHLTVEESEEEGEYGRVAEGWNDPRRSDDRPSFRPLRSEPRSRSRSRSRSPPMQEH
jgi:hypothetical protein